MKLKTFRLEFKNQDFQTTVPSEVHLVLMENGVIEDPYSNYNELKQKWISKHDWKFKTTFKAEIQKEKQEIILYFQGVDTISIFYLLTFRFYLSQQKPYWNNRKYV